MLLHEGGNIIRAHAAIFGPLRQQDDMGALFALVEAAGAFDRDGVAEVAIAQFRRQLSADFVGPTFTTTGFLTNENFGGFGLGLGRIQGGGHEFRLHRPRTEDNVIRFEGEDARFARSPPLAVNRHPMTRLNRRIKPMAQGFRDFKPIVAIVNPHPQGFQLRSILIEQAL